MANEIVTGDLISNGGLLAEVLGPAIQAKFDASDLGSLMVRIPWNQRGSTVMQIPVLPAPGALAAFSSEASPSVGNSAYTTAKRQLTIAGRGRALQNSDISQIVAGAVNVDVLAANLAQSLGLTVTDLLTALFSGVSGNVGTSGADATVDDVFSAIFALNLANSSGRIAAVLHAQQINDVMTSVRGEGGAFAYTVDAQRALAAGAGFGYKFSLLGVDFYQSDSVPTANAGADRQGCFFTPDAFGYTIADPRMVDPMVLPADVYLMTPELMIERVRDGANRLTQWQATAYCGAVELQDTSAVKFTTDA